MLTLTGGLVIRSELLIPLFNITQDHSPFLFGRFSGDDDLVAVLPSVVTVEEFEEPRVSVVGLFKGGLESEVGLFGLCGERGLLSCDVVKTGLFHNIVQNFLLASVDAEGFRCQFRVAERSKNTGLT